jgi:hypothetical protein
MPFASLASTLHLAEILEKGYHFSTVQYVAFNEPQTATGKDTEEYLKAILQDAQLEISKNYVFLKQTELSDSLPDITNSVVTDPTVAEKENNFFDLEKAKSCATRAMLQIKLLMFHQSMKRQDLTQHLESTLRLERGFIQDTRLGLVCGSYLGQLGEIQPGGLVEEFKILNLVSREDQKDILRFFKLNSHYLESKTPVSMKLFKYLKTKMLVNSYKKLSVKGIDFSIAKEEFKTKYLNSYRSVHSGGISFDPNQSLVASEIDDAYMKVAHELL